MHVVLSLTPIDFNCNSFTNDCVGFLTGESIPAWIKGAFLTFSVCQCAFSGYQTFHPTSSPPLLGPRCALRSILCTGDQPPRLTVFLRHQPHQPRPSSNSRRLFYRPFLTARRLLLAPCLLAPPPALARLPPLRSPHRFTSRQTRLRSSLRYRRIAYPSRSSHPQHVGHVE
jgi:hypothetical protein